MFITVSFPSDGKTEKDLYFYHMTNKLFIMAIQVVEFSNGGTKLERFLPKNQHTQKNIM